MKMLQVLLFIFSIDKIIKIHNIKISNETLKDTIH